MSKTVSEEKKNSLRKGSKRKFSDEEDNSETDEKNDVNGATDPEDEGSTIMSPKDMYVFCKQMLDLHEKNIIKVSKKSGLLNMELLLNNLRDEINLPAHMNPKEMQTAFRSYYKSASMLKNVSFEAALKRVKEFSAEEVSVLHHPNYPKPPNGVFSIFAKKEGYSTLNIPHELRVAFRDGTHPDIEACKEEAAIEKNKYPDALEAFLNENKDLFDEQIDFVRKKIRLLRGKTNPVEKSVAKPKPTTKKKKLTAFDFFKNSRKHKYTDLDEDTREEKLKRRFEKLDQEKKSIFESLEANQ